MMSRVFGWRGALFAVSWVLLVFLGGKLTMMQGEEMYSFNPYKILGVEEGAEMGAVKKAYRRLSLINHPDKNQGNPEANDLFIKVAKAYEVLTDDATRENYEKYGNPDGYHGTSVTIGLPSWLTNKDNELAVRSPPGWQTRPPHPRPHRLTLTASPSPPRPHRLALTLALTASPSPSPSPPCPHPRPHRLTLTLAASPSPPRPHRLTGALTSATPTLSPRFGRASPARPPCRRTSDPRRLLSRHHHRHPRRRRPLVAQLLQVPRGRRHAEHGLPLLPAGAGQHSD